MLKIIKDSTLVPTPIVDLKLDSEPRQGSTDPVTSEGVKTAIDGAVGDAAEALQQQIDDIADKAGSGYIPKGEASVATLNALSGQENGWLYTMTDAGTLTDGSLAVVAGDTVAWDATNSVWYKAMDYAPRQYGTNEVHNLPTTITAFRTGDVIPVDGPSGTAKMSKDDLLRVTAENALAGNVVSAFVITKLFAPNDKVSYNGKVYVFKNWHIGNWNSSDVNEVISAEVEKSDVVVEQYSATATNFIKKTYSFNAPGLRISPTEDLIKPLSTYRVRGFAVRKGDVIKIHQNAQTTDEYIAVGFTNANTLSANDVVKVVQRIKSSSTAEIDLGVFIAQFDGYLLYSTRASLWSGTSVYIGNVGSKLYDLMDVSDEVIGNTDDVGNARFMVATDNDVELSSAERGYAKLNADVGSVLTFTAPTSTYMSYGKFDVSTIGSVVVNTRTYHNDEGYYVYITDENDVVLKRDCFTSYVRSARVVYVSVPSGAKYLYVTCYSGVEDYGSRVSVYEGTTVGLRDVIAQSGSDTTDTVWEDYIQRKIEEIHTRELGFSAKASRFFFVTDTHWYYKNGSIGGLSNYGKSLGIINKIAKKVACDCVVFGGDTVYAAASIEATFKSAFFIQNNYERMPRIPMLGVQGNHDFKSTGGTDGTILYEQDATKNILLYDCYNVIKTPNNDACYYYYDDVKSKLRYVVWASTTAGVNSITEAQAKWIVENAILDAPSDFDFAFICHICIGSKVINGAVNVSSCGLLMTVASAINGRTSVTIDGMTYNFASLSGKVLFYLSGHDHADNQTYFNGVLCINTASDTLVSENATHSMYFNHAVPRGKTLRSQWEAEGNTIGTNGQLLDYMVVDKDNDVVECIRVGAYFDRKFHVGYIEANVGDSITITPSLSGTLTYHCYDNDAEYASYVVEDDKTVTSVWNGLDATPIISSNGDGTYNADSVGEAVIMVMDENQNKEFWGVKIS